MLLRYISRALNKPTLMADHTSQTSPNARKIPSLFGSPKFKDFTLGTEALKSPTSTLDTRILSPYGFGNPFSYDNNNNNKTPKTVPNKTSSSSSWDKADSKGIGLALVGCLKDDEKIDDKSFEPNKGNVLFGTQLRVKIPPFADGFGTKKTKETSNSETDVIDSSPSRGFLSLSEMELSEEYTCVITHGPNPKTTHIFNNCIVETYCSLPQNSASSGNFLSVCYTCKKHLDQTKDIFIYRGEKAFCSRECRHREMVLDGVENLEFQR